MSFRKLLGLGLFVIPIILIAATLSPGVAAQAWIDSASGAPLPANAVAGGEENGHRLYVCRASYNGGVHPGKVVAGNCNIGFGGDEIVLQQYQVLVTDVSPHSFPEWGAPKDELAGAFVGGRESSGSPLAVCRAAYNGGIHPGKVVGDNCNIPYAHREIHVPQFEVLYWVEPWVSTRSGAPLPARAAIAGEENGAPVYTCRGSYSGGVHPGKVVGDNCYIGFAGKEIILHEYQVMVRMKDYTISWGPPKEGLAEAFAGGHESGHPLFVCRGEYKGGIESGKVVSDNCNIGYVGLEIKLPRFEVLYWMKNN
jgi:hypothetical protein